MQSKKNKKNLGGPQYVRKFGAFSGVFVPTFLSTIGVIMYLRLGFIVGSVGIFSSILIILLAASITLATGLSLSSITTNIRIGAGGAYSIISKSLGLEVGGSVGIPLYLAQVFSVVLYVLGFAEAWQFIFPGHPFQGIVLAAFVLLFALTIISTATAIRAQLVVFVVVLASLVSIFAGGGWLQGLSSEALVTRVSDSSFWALFALFFPAVTGLMAGVGLSGDLKDPKRQIPRGVISSLIITTLIYIAMVYWFGYSASSAALTSNNLIIVDLAAYGNIVLAGILAGTFSSALTTFVAAPRLLQAMANNSILPWSTVFSKTVSSEPRNALVLTSIIVIVALLLGSLNSIAPVLTMFFLITYAMINMVVFIEQSLGLPSFRPTFKVPILIPLYGAVGSISFMFLISAMAGLIALIFLFVTYLTLVQRKLVQKEGDVRSSLFRTLSEWAAKKVQNLPESAQHTWKPNVLLPALDSSTVLGNFALIKAISYPNGTMTVLGMRVRQKKTEPVTDQGLPVFTSKEDKLKNLQDIVEKFGNEGIFTFSSVVDVDDYSKGIAVSLEAIESQVFHPNIVLLPFKPRQFTSSSLHRIFSAAEENNVSVALFDRDEEMGLGSQQDIHVWIAPRVLKKDFYEDRDFDLALLIAYKLYRNWKGRITLWMCVSKEQESTAKSYLKRLIYESRFPSSTKIQVVTDSFYKTLKSAPQGDIHIISTREEDLRDISKIAKIKGKSFLYVSDSTLEDVLA